MQIIKLNQQQDRSAWLDARRGVITGTKAKAVAPPARGNKTPQGVFELLAEHLAIEKDGESERDRGLRLEQEAILKTQDKFKLDLTFEAGLWLSDDGKLGVSPDACQNNNKPTYAVEAKCLDSKNHLQAILNDYEAKQQDSYNPLSSLKIGTSDYTAQVVQYFTINPDLQTLYFTLYDDRIVLENIMHYVIQIDREQVKDLAIEQELHQREVVIQVNVMIKILKGIK
jgi:hypothetical protein